MSLNGLFSFAQFPPTNINTTASLAVTVSSIRCLAWGMPCYVEWSSRRLAGVQGSYIDFFKSTRFVTNIYRWIWRYPLDCSLGEEWKRRMAVILMKTLWNERMEGQHHERCKLTVTTVNNFCMDWALGMGSFSGRYVEIAPLSPPHPPPPMYVSSLGCCSGCIVFKYCSRRAHGSSALVHECSTWVLILFIGNPLLS